MINKVARELNICMRNYNAVQSKNSLRKHVLVCRYGGDEFAMVTVGYTESEARAINDVVRGLLQSMELPPNSNTHYGDKLRLKGGGNIQSERGTDGDGGDNSGRVVTPLNEIYPAGFTTEEQTEFWNLLEQSGIIADQSEIQLALENNRQNRTIKSAETGRLSILEEFKQRMKNDLLLNSPVYSFHVLQERMMQGLYNQYIGFDIKCIKEYNETAGMAFSDRLIHQFFQKITDILGEEADAFDIYRRGSTFILAHKKTMDVSISTVDRLRGLNSFTVDENGLIPVGVGFLQKNVLLRDIINQTEQNWYEHVVEKMMKINSYKDPLGDIELENGIDQNEQTNVVKRGKIYGFDTIVRLFFHGKRKKERFAKLQTVIDIMIRQDFASAADEKENFYSVKWEERYRKLISVRNYVRRKMEDQPGQEEEQRVA